MTWWIKENAFRKTRPIKRDLVHFINTVRILLSVSRYQYMTPLRGNNFCFFYFHSLKFENTCSVLYVRVILSLLHIYHPTFTCSCLSRQVLLSHFQYEIKNLNVRYNIYFHTILDYIDKQDNLKNSTGTDL